MSGKSLDPHSKPYFIWWDQKVTVADVRRVLASDDLYGRVTYMSYILNDADFEDVWKFMTLQEVQKHFWQIRWRTSSQQETWRQILILMGYPPNECADPRAARILK